MIRAVLIINAHGNVRLARFYEDVKEHDQQKMIGEVFSAISRRDEHLCNFLEGLGEWDRSSRIIYRHYATLYFVFWVDQSESELAILDLIQVFVEALDKCFEFVCELDVIFHVDKVHFILDELVMGGMVVETNLQNIVSAVETQNKMDSTMSRPQKHKSPLPSMASLPKSIPTLSFPKH